MKGRLFIFVLVCLLSSCDTNLMIDRIIIRDFPADEFNKIIILYYPSGSEFKKPEKVAFIDNKYSANSISADGELQIDLSIHTFLTEKNDIRILIDDTLQFDITHLMIEQQGIGKAAVNSIVGATVNGKIFSEYLGKSELIFPASVGIITY